MWCHLTGKQQLLLMQPGNLTTPQMHHAWWSSPYTNSDNRGFLFLLTITCRHPSRWSTCLEAHGWRAWYLLAALRQGSVGTPDPVILSDANGVGPVGSVVMLLIKSFFLQSNQHQKQLLDIMMTVPCPMAHNTRGALLRKARWSAYK